MNKLKTIFLLLAFILAMNMSGVQNIKAENYPYKSDYLWLTVPDHADWLYQTGENAKVEVSFCKYGIPRDGELKYSIGNDMLQPDKHGSVKLKNGRAVINMGTKKTPGFRDMKLSVSLDGKTYEHHIKVGFSVDKIKPYTQEPQDFRSFWQKNVEELKQVPMSYTKELYKDYCTDKIDCYLVKLQIDKMGHSMYGFLFYPKNAQPGKHPVVLCPPGAGIKTIKDPMRNKYYAENGFVRFEVEIHGLDPRISSETFGEISRAFNDRNGGYLANGLENKDIYYMKHVYVGLVRCIDFLTSLPEWDGKNVAVQGGSQGGALAIIAAGLDSRVTQCVANHPALSDMAGYAAKGGTGGYPHFCRQPQILSNKDCLNTLAYFDVVNFARYVKAPTYLTWGYNDVTCPPTTSYAVWNTLKCTKESLLTPINEHWTTTETNRGQMEWIKAHLLK
ncbi:acetylxylan esterase [Prevotella copri]|jgi:cephalosporin-C deacetylase|uniref:Acetylxylan esterase n=2 Tax=Segatella copri TaxID=165179 RepID=A0A6A7WCH9_9BACT|nr:acetylxylan esterase [Segatella copri]